MRFVIYHRDTTKFLRIIRQRNWTDAEFGSMTAAKACLTRLEAKGKINRDDYLIEEKAKFHRDIEKTEIVYSIMDKDKRHPITQGVNTPSCLDPSTELYHSM